MKHIQKRKTSQSSFTLLEKIKVLRDSPPPKIQAIYSIFYLVSLEGIGQTCGWWTTFRNKGQLAKYTVGEPTGLLVTLSTATKSGSRNRLRGDGHRGVRDFVVGRRG